MAISVHGRQRGWFSNLNHEHPLFLGGFIGGLIGYFIVSPIAMILEHLTHTGTEDLGQHLYELLTFQTLEWTLLFTTLMICIGVMFGYMQMRINKLEGVLFQTEKMASVGQLAAGVAHEINTPISNISLLAEKMRMNSKDGKEISDHDLNEISAQVEYASRIITDLLDFSRPWEAEPNDLNLNEIISDTLSFVRNMKSEDVNVNEEYDENIPVFKGDQNRLTRVFMNIINNAYDSMPEGGELSVHTRRTENGDIKITFKDSGLGISKENLPKIFDPFFTTKSPGKGTGLGLSICHGIIRSYNGKIQVDSKVNKGTTITIILPG